MSHRFLITGLRWIVKLVKLANQIKARKRLMRLERASNQNWVLSAAGFDGLRWTQNVHNFKFSFRFTIHSIYQLWFFKSRCFFEFRFSSLDALAAKSDENGQKILRLLLPWISCWSKSFMNCVLCESLLSVRNCVSHFDTSGVFKEPGEVNLVYHLA